MPQNVGGWTDWTHLAGRAMVAGTWEGQLGGVNFRVDARLDGKVNLSVTGDGKTITGELEPSLLATLAGVLLAEASRAADISSISPASAGPSLSNTVAVRPSEVGMTAIQETGGTLGLVLHFGQSVLTIQIDDPDTLLRRLQQVLERPSLQN